MLDASAVRWHEVLDLYGVVVKEMAKGKKKDKAEQLLELDNWFQQELPVSISSREEKYLTKDELTKLMTWKLSRGKFRPRLVDLIKSNSDDKIDTLTKKAFKLLPDVIQAIKVLSELNGVGPATASAILCAGSPNVPFMADEAMASLPSGQGKLQYTPKAYQAYLDDLRGVLTKLQKEDPEGKWDEHKVELALWTYTVASKHAPHLLDSGKTSKRKTSENTNEGIKRSKK
ncbi:predicted protein [Nematostella vectensis]|uniref:Uncharacterized protein n=2 Tax=Nematostella vectensis TaxID=45351 RepID=A7SMR4_NEMVE|nr:predicted protein [Nematostella vectensis]|eukprot:XP_001627115.1 predicted protein [Nematostella vectensis]